MVSPRETLVTEELSHYLAERFWPEDDLLRSVREDIERRGPTIQVSVETGHLLATLVASAGAERVLEVGTLFGYSAIWMARSLSADGHLDTIEISDVHADAAEEWFSRAGLADRITVHRGPALEVLPTLSGPYDVAFIDADKAPYPEYGKHALRLLRPGGLLLADNVLWSGRVADPSQEGPDIEGIRAFLGMIARDPLITTVIPVGDGVSLSVTSGRSQPSG